MHPTQHSTLPRRPQTAGEAVAMMAEHLQRLAQAQNIATAKRLNIAPDSPRQSSQPRPSAACILAASPMADNPWHVAIFLGLLCLGHIAALVLWALKVAPKHREFEEPEDDAVITVSRRAMLPSCTHMVPLRDHCPYCAGTHQPLTARHA